jgi:hypothetical protein
VTEPRLELIEGQRTLVVERRPPLQPKLDGLLSALFHIRAAKDIRPSGTRAACEIERDHRFDLLREGRHVGLDGVVRDLRVRMCLDCGATEVRDVSYDRLPGLPTASGGPARRDEVIGWYSGKRRAGREYT